MKKFLTLGLMVLMALAFSGCGSAPTKKSCQMKPAPTYDDTGVKQNVRRALDDADTQLPSRKR